MRRSPEWVGVVQYEGWKKPEWMRKETKSNWNVRMEASEDMSHELCLQVGTVSASQRLVRHEHCKTSYIPLYNSRKDTLYL